MENKKIKSKEQFYSQILKDIKSRCSERGIFLIFDKLENDGGVCKYKNKTYIMINKLYNDEQRIKLFFNEICNTDFKSDFEDIKRIFTGNFPENDATA